MIRVKVIPASGVGVPSYRERLQPPAGELNEVLLKGFDAKCIGDFELGESTVRALRFDEVGSISHEEACRHSGVFKARVVEISEDRICIRDLHG